MAAHDQSSADTKEIPPLPPSTSWLPDPPHTVVEIGAVTHRGLRPTNEDSYYVGKLERQFRTLATNLRPPIGADRPDDIAYGFLVADGLGGERAGDVASRLAVEMFVELVLHTPDWILRIDNAEANRVLGRIVDRYRRVGAAVAEVAASDRDFAGMGTTLTLACSAGAQLFLGHVGDSRAYVIRGNEIKRMTKDHTYAQTLADAGMIPQEEVDQHRLRHVLTRALGSQGSEVQVEVGRHVLQDGDVVLVCTDGLTTMVPDEAIRDVVQSNPAQQACELLLEKALAAGGHDNITVVLGRYRFPATWKPNG
jgi:protein phosphatase